MRYQHSSQRGSWQAGEGSLVVHPSATGNLSGSAGLRTEPRPWPRHPAGTGRGVSARLLFMALVTLTLGETELISQPPESLPAATYAAAERSLAWNIPAMARNVEPVPIWIARDPERFWYRRDTDAGWEYRVVDAATGRAGSAFDHRRLASAVGGAPVDSNRLEVLEITGPPGSRRVRVRTRDGVQLCQLATYRCELANQRFIPGGDSPEGSWRVVRNGARLALARDDEQVPLEMAPLGDSTSARVVWAPGGQAAFLEMFDTSVVDRAPLVAALDQSGRPSPRLIPFTGGTRASPEAPSLSFALVLRSEDPQRGWEVVPVGLDATGWSSAIAGGQVFWTRDGAGLFLLLASRDGTRLALWDIDSKTGSATSVIDEHDDEGVLWNLHWGGSPNVRVGADARRVVWFSERDGWGHLWLYSLGSDEPPRQLTRGRFVVRDIVWIDDAADRLLVTLAGFDPAADPYHRDLAALDVASGTLTRLTFADADHAVSVSPAGSHYVVVSSALDRDTTMSVHRADGSLVRIIETSDISRLRHAGWSWPRREAIPLQGVPGDLYATVLLPTSFDPTARYPVVECLYPLPDGAWAPVRLGDALLNRFTHAQAIANLGFVVVFIDAPGTGLRSRAFRAGSRGDLHAVGLDDRARALKVLGSRYPQMDLERVGVYGNSGGANATVRALLARPDIYDVAVASGGNHDLRFGGPWVERHQGLTPGPASRETNANLAPRLAGKLLLAHGALDRVVHPAQTLSLAQAFIDANRDADVLLLPNRGHDVLNDPYFLRRMWDFFVEHLQKRRPPEYRVADPPRWVR